MNGISYDDWQTFLEQRGGGPGWQWPLNIAVAMHLAVFGGALFLQHMQNHSSGFKSDNIVTVNLISMAEPGPPAPIVGPMPVVKDVAPSVKMQDKPTERKVISTARAKVEPEKKPISVKPAVKKIAESQKPVLKEVTEKKVEVTPKEPVVKTAEPPVEIKPAPAVKKTVAPVPEPKVAEVPAPKPERVPAPAVKNAVSLNPVKPVEDKVREQQSKEARLAEIKKQEELARIAEAKKQEEQAKAAAARKKLAEEQKAKLAAEKQERAKIAEAKKQELAKAAKVEQEKKAAAVEARKKLALEQRRKALAEARRIEREAELAEREAVNAKKQLVQALRESLAVSSAVAAGAGTGAGAGNGNGPGAGGGAGNRRGSGNGSGAGYANPALLNQYASLLNEKISSRWKVPEIASANRKLKTLVALTISRSGSIEEMKIEQKSGDTLFDQSVVKALRSAEPLPNFPAMIREPKLEFALNFTPQGLTL